MCPHGTPAAQHAALCTGVQSSIAQPGTTGTAGNAYLLLCSAGPLHPTSSPGDIHTQASEDACLDVRSLQDAPGPPTAAHLNFANGITAALAREGPPVPWLDQGQPHACAVAGGGQASSGKLVRGSGSVAWGNAHVRRLLVVIICWWQGSRSFCHSLLDAILPHCLVPP